MTFVEYLFTLLGLMLVLLYYSLPFVLIVALIRYFWRKGNKQ